MTIAVLLLAISTARAADRVYWTTFSGSKTVFSADLAGGPALPLNTAPVVPKEPGGLAIDPIGGRIYWADHTGGTISYANLDGGGGILETGAATVAGPIGVAIDPIGRKIYWSNEGNKISWARLDGGGGADLNTGSATVAAPLSIALDLVAGRVYWANFSTPSIAYANVDGSGGATLPITGTATFNTPLGLAIDRAAGRIYWANDNPGKISYANLDGSGSSDLNTSGATAVQIYGVSIDPQAGRIYWANSTAGKLSYANLDGSGGGDLPITGLVPEGQGFPVLYETPRATAAPGISRSHLVRRPRVLKKSPRPRKRLPRKIVGVSLICSPGSWAPDLVESFLYRAPLSTSLQWTRGGSDIPGATSTALTTQAVGSYRCRETATNHAGTASQLSPVAAFFKVGKAKLDKRKGIARLPVELPAGGRFTVAGRAIVDRTTQASGKRKITIKPVGREKARLGDTGRAKVKAKLTFMPAEGPPVSQSVRITLRKRLPR